MKLLQKILFPTDFSPSADRDLENAISIAKKFESELVVIHVLPNYPSWSPFIVKIRQKVDDQMGVIEAKLKTSGIKYQVSLEFGNYAEQISKVARRENVNLTLLGAGTPKNDYHVLGTNSEKIIRSSGIPVWVMQNDWVFSLETILCPVDFSETSKRALENAIHLARRFNSKLLVLHVAEALEEFYTKFDVDLESEMETFEKEESQSFDNFLAQFNLTDVNYQKILKTGNAEDIIRTIIDQEVVDLLIMGTHGRTGLQRFFLGSVTEKVILSVPCSFITVKNVDFIKLSIDKEITNIEEAYKQAVQLAKDGYLQEALAELNRCLEMNELNVKAWRGKAEIYEKLGDKDKATHCDAQADKIQKAIWEKQIEADLRRQHSMFK